MSLSISALFVRNLYSVIITNRSEKHYIWVGRLTVAAVLILGIFVALYATGVIALLKFIIAVSVTFGAPILLIFIWRRLTRMAVLVEVVACIMVITLAPWLIPAIPGMRTSESLTVCTDKQYNNINLIATQKDVVAGLAEKEGQKIQKTLAIEPVSIFFESVAHIDPYNKDSKLVGIGVFSVEVYIMSKLGMNVHSLSPAGLMTTRFLFDGIFPFIILFIVSFFTKPNEKIMLDRFYVKMKTPVQSNQQLDAIEIEKSYSQPHRFDYLKLFPNSSWEFHKWDKQDTIGFICCWIVVFIILAIFLAALHIGG
ncbi:MAG: hypothetical protein A2Y10_04280 [Planctomycetes bacterium GWF2_41_51]|nr:MAG: hypothetical protein A2Y10_04280 [Planctomycetes bacterium GWF2_41_51]HBG27815.1 hypothetical protein [Phycisphaerales bacterium]